MTMPIDLVLVRHGESEGNIATDRVKARDSRLMRKLNQVHTSGWRLTDQGRNQALSAGEWLREAFPKGFDRQIVSAYVRARETAGLLNLTGGTRWQINHLIVERNWGHASSADAEARRFGLIADDLARRVRDEPYWAPFGGESIAQLLTRIYPFFDGLHREDSDNRVLVVCHGEIMWAMRMLLERMSIEQYRLLDQSKDPKDRIHNCQIIHYTRRNPESGAIDTAYRWMRSICPWNPNLSSQAWHEVIRHTYSSADLLKDVEAYPRFLERE